MAFPVGASVGDLFESVCEKDGQEAIHIAKKSVRDGLERMRCTILACESSLYSCDFLTFAACLLSEVRFILHAVRIVPSTQLNSRFSLA